MLPLYVPAANELELTLTLKEYGVVGFALALVDSQLPPLVVVGVTVKPTPAVPEALLTEMDWAPGLDPDCELKVSDVGDTVTFPVLPPVEVLTLSDTPTV